MISEEAMDWSWMQVLCILGEDVEDGNEDGSIAIKETSHTIDFYTKWGNKAFY